MRRGNGEGSVFKLGGTRRKSWAARVTVGWTEEGKQKMKYIGYYRTKTEAKEALRNFLVNPYNIDNNKITVKDVYDKWKKETTLSDQTLTSYVTIFNRNKQLHNIPIRDLKVSHIETAIESLTPSLGHHLRNCLNQLFNYAMKHEIVDKNIVKLVTTKTVARGKQKVPFTIDQINAIKNFKHPHADTAVILLYTGLRISELLALENKNVFLDKRYMIGGLKTKAGKDRIIPIHDDIYDLIKTRYNPNEKYLILNRFNNQMTYKNYKYNFWDRMKKALDIDKTPHETRHTFITQADKCQLDRLVIQRIVGHSTGEITDHYTYRSIEEMIKEMNKLKYE